MQRTLYLFFLLTFTFTAASQKLWQKQGLQIPHPVCYASDKVEKSFVPPPADVIKRLKSGEKKSEIIVSYSLFPQQARVAFEYAVEIWEGLIDSPVPIYIQANWRTKDSNVLGSCGPSDFEKNFPGAPYENIYYPIALAEKIQGLELTGSGRPDMVAEFNKDIDWYFGLDGNTPLMLYDFVSVVLHEIAHGLGFTGFFFALDLTAGYSWWDWGDATSFDNLIINAQKQQLINTSLFDNPSANLRNQLTSNELYFRSPVTLATGSDTYPRIYAPNDWNDGSSIYHLDYRLYPPGNINTLMTHTYGRGQAVHHPGPVTLGILADIGWKNLKFEHAPLKDQEIIGPLNLEAQIISDYPIDNSKVFLYFSTDSFRTNYDSIPLIQSESNTYKAQLNIDPATISLHYYLGATDSMNRTFTLPNAAPDAMITVNFGPDKIIPVIDHEPLSYFFDTGDRVEIRARVEDNLGIDTVYVEYSVNGAEKQSFGLIHEDGFIYSGAFPPGNEEFNDKDVITYHIVAVDASSAGNKSTFPEVNNLTFEVEKMMEPVTFYQNQFESNDHDFLLHDFDIFHDMGFENGALHSPHPYPSPDEDDMEFNFFTLLKHPVILQDNALLSYDEIVLVEPGDSGTIYGDSNFWDFVIVEGSKNKGITWLPLTDGYDSRKQPLWEENFYHSIADMNSTTIGNSQLYISNQINMLANGNFSKGDTILIRFRLFSDPYAHGWGWAIDNLQIQVPLTASNSILLPGKINVYPNPFKSSFKVVTESTEVINMLQFELYNMQGQKISTELLRNITGTLTSEIKINSINPGIYFLVIKENGKQVFTKKMIHN